MNIDVFRFDCFALIGIIQSSLFVKYLALIKENLHPSRANFAWLTLNRLEKKGVGRGIKIKIWLMLTINPAVNPNDRVYKKVLINCQKFEILHHTNSFKIWHQNLQMAPGKTILVNTTSINHRAGPRSGATERGHQSTCTPGQCI